VFSDKKVQRLARGFICVKVDPRERVQAWEFKSTRYVPEVVFLTNDLEVIARLEDRTVPGTARLMQKILDRYR